jgi:hypothetical protein
VPEGIRDPIPIHNAPSSTRLPQHGPLTLATASARLIPAGSSSSAKRAYRRPDPGPKMTESLVRNKPGMASIKEMPVVQDGPPPGGFAPVRFARRIPTSGPSATAIFLTTFGAFAYGMYQVGQGNKVRR